MKHEKSKGFTLIELMVVLVIVAILAMIAIPNFRDFLRNSALVSSANQLVASIESSKGEALKRNKRVLIVPLGAGWGSGWRAFIDEDNDAAFGAGDMELHTSAALPDYLSVSASSNSTASASSPYLMFDGSGFPRDASTGAFAANTISISRNDLPAGSGVRRVMIGATGRVRSCRPQSDTDKACLASAGK
ncbi:MAG: GspH/FimT family pseudopilin [Brachymonas sp.]|nr:GspH/FimT family pseudopilin [Brachymonas sp.]